MSSFHKTSHTARRGFQPTGLASDCISCKWVGDYHASRSCIPVKSASLQERLSWGKDRSEMMSLYAFYVGIRPPRQYITGWNVQSKEGRVGHINHTFPLSIVFIVDTIHAHPHRPICCRSYFCPLQSTVNTLPCLNPRTFVRAQFLSTPPPIHHR
jgi:hypothetical protein